MSGKRQEPSMSPAGLQALADRLLRGRYLSEAYDRAGRQLGTYFSRSSVLSNDQALLVADMVVRLARDAGLLAGLSEADLAELAERVLEGLPN